MTINLDDKKLIKVVYELNETTEVEIDFNDGNIVNVHKKYKEPETTEIGSIRKMINLTEEMLPQLTNNSDNEKEKIITDTKKLSKYYKTRKIMDLCCNKKLREDDVDFGELMAHIDENGSWYKTKQLIAVDVKTTPTVNAKAMKDITVSEAIDLVETIDNLTANQSINQENRDKLTNIREELTNAKHLGDFIGILNDTYYKYKDDVDLVGLMYKINNFLEEYNCKSQGRETETQKEEKENG